MRAAPGRSSSAIKLARDLGIRTIQLAGYDAITKSMMKAPGNASPKGWHGQSSRPPPRR